MDKRINRFKLCDLRFCPYFVRVIERLPEEVSEDVLNDESFHFFTDDEILDACVLRYEFNHPVKTLVYLNTKILMEPGHQIIHTVASEIARYVLKKEGTCMWERKLDELLIKWGFGKEVEAVRYDSAISESKGYRVGYEWAQKQNRDYLMQHFGLYFDEWDEKGLASQPGDGFKMLPGLDEPGLIHDEMMRSNKGNSLESEKKDTSEASSLRKAMLAGIMTAVKELRLHDLYDPKNCGARHTSI